MTIIAATITFNELQIWMKSGTDSSNIAIQADSISATTQKTNDSAGNYDPANIANENINDARPRETLSPMKALIVQIRRSLLY